MSNIDSKLASGDLEGAKEIAKATPVPAASVIYEGLRNVGGGAEGVESRRDLWICPNVFIRERINLDISIYCIGTDVGILRNGCRYDSSL